MYCEQRKKVYFIHENYTPTIITGKCVHLVTDYNIIQGYLCIFDEFEKGSRKIYLGKEVDDLELVQLKNFVPDTIFDTQQDAEKFLIKIMLIKYNNDETINKKLTTLAEKYPEAVI